MWKDRFPTKTVRHPSSFSEGGRGARMGLAVEYLMLSHRPPKSAPLCSRAAAAPAAALNSMMAVFRAKDAVLDEISTEIQMEFFISEKATL